jgi:histone H3/H4
MSEEYARELSKMAVSKAAVALGYKYAQPEAIDCLADVMRKYVEELAEETQSGVESYGRTNPGIMDVFSVLQKPVCAL